MQYPIKKIQEISFTELLGNTLQDTDVPAAARESLGMLNAMYHQVQHCFIYTLLAPNGNLLTTLSFYANNGRKQLDCLVIGDMNNYVYQNLDDIYWENIDTYQQKRNALGHQKFYRCVQLESLSALIEHGDMTFKTYHWPHDTRGNYVPKPKETWVLLDFDRNVFAKMNHIPLIDADIPESQKDTPMDIFGALERLADQTYKNVCKPDAKRLNAPAPRPAPEQEPPVSDAFAWAIPAPIPNVPVKMAPATNTPPAPARNRLAELPDTENDGIPPLFKYAASLRQSSH